MSIERRNTKVTTTTKKEIRQRYEYGEDLKDLAYEFRLSYGTLKNISSKEKWEKGKRAQLLYLAEVEEDIAKHKEAMEEIKGHYRNLHKSVLAYMIDLERNKERPAVKAREEALKNRVQAIKENYAFAKDLYNIMTPMEEVDYKVKLARYEQHKRELLKEEDEDDTEI